MNLILSNLQLFCPNNTQDNEREATHKDKVFANAITAQLLHPKYNKNPRNTTEGKETTCLCNKQRLEWVPPLGYREGTWAREDAHSTPHVFGAFRTGPQSKPYPHHSGSGIREVLTTPVLAGLAFSSWPIPRWKLFPLQMECVLVFNEAPRCGLLHWLKQTTQAPVDTQSPQSGSDVCSDSRCPLQLPLSYVLSCKWVGTQCSHHLHWVHCIQQLSFSTTSTCEFLLLLTMI